MYVHILYIDDTKYEPTTEFMNRLSKLKTAQCIIMNR